MRLRARTQSEQRLGFAISAGLLLSFCLAGLWTAAAQTPAPSSPDQLRAMMRDVLSQIQITTQNLSGYAYTRFNIRRQYDSDGTLTSEHTFQAKRDFLEDYGYTLQVARDGKPVPQEELDRGEQAARERMMEWRAMSAQQRAEAEKEEHKRAREEAAWLKEFPDALDYKKVGEEMIDGRPAWIIDLSPRPGYQASNIRARVFAKTKGRAWVDAADHALVKLEAEVFETVNIGWGVIGKVQKGTRFAFEQRKVKDDWLPRSQAIRFSARLLLIKSLAQEEITRYSDYRLHSPQVASGQAPAGAAVDSTRVRSTR